MGGDHLRFTPARWFARCALPTLQCQATDREESWTEPSTAKQGTTSLCHTALKATGKKAVPGAALVSGLQRRLQRPLAFKVTLPPTNQREGCQNPEVRGTMGKRVKNTVNLQCHRQVPGKRDFQVRRRMTTPVLPEATRWEEGPSPSGVVLVTTAAPDCSLVTHTHPTVKR